MTPPVEPPKQKRFLSRIALGVVFLSAGVAVVSTTGWFASAPVGVSGHTLLDSAPSAALVSAGAAAASVPLSGPAGRNPTYPRAPVPGSAVFRVLSFAELFDKQAGSPGTRAARDLLIRTKNGDAAAAEALYSGSQKNGFDEYERAVFLNTVADIHNRDYRLLEDATFIRFYFSKKKDPLASGIVISGVTQAKLNDARMGLGGFMGLMGHRSPKTDKVASLEATAELRGTGHYAFDVDLYNPKSDPDKHSAEIDFNDTTPATTHPADVSRALRLRGILSGVITL